MNKITKTCASNIALVKYWGKKDIQIPMNPSISMTLKKSFTETHIWYNENKENSKNQISFLFEGKENQAFENRIKTFIESITKYIPVLVDLNLNIESKNSFPHSTGIASSASAMGALALCLVGIESKLSGTDSNFKDNLQKASFIARLGSGSAARSIYPGYTLWGEIDSHSNSSNEFAIPINNHIHEVFKNYGDAILIVSDKKKSVSSSLGHSLMNNHPFAESKFKESYRNTNDLLNILSSGDQLEFAKLVEAEALSLHAMMMTSNPNFILMEPNTVAIINKIQNFREATKIPICFTLDAGANVHLLYPDANKVKTIEFIENELTPLCKNGKWINDHIDLA